MSRGRDKKVFSYAELMAHVERLNEREMSRNPEAQRGLTSDYKGDDPFRCNARTRAGHPCKAVALAGGRCKWHGGLSTGPRTPEGKARSAMNLHKARILRAASKLLDEHASHGGSPAKTLVGKSRH